MHSVIVDHDLREVDRVDFRTSHEVATERCADCGAERKIFEDYRDS